MGKQIVCLLFIAALGLIGGAVFQHLELPNQEYEYVMEKKAEFNRLERSSTFQITVQRHRNFSHQILTHLAKNDCFSMVCLWKVYSILTFS